MMKEVDVSVQTNSNYTTSAVTIDLETASPVVIEKFECMVDESGESLSSRIFLDSPNQVVDISDAIIRYYSNNRSSIGGIELNLEDGWSMKDSVISSETMLAIMVSSSNATLENVRLQGARFIGEVQKLSMDLGSGFWNSS